jgi:hypothetical protein
MLISCFLLSRGAAQQSLSLTQNVTPKLSPLSFLKRSVRNTIRSGLFLVAYVVGYQAQICTQRKLVQRGWFSKDHRFWYYLFGLSTALSILIEDKKRRSELGMYVAPKAIHSLYQIITEHKKWIPRWDHMNVAIFSGSMATIMSFYVSEPERLSSMMLRTLPRFIW